MTSSLCHSFQRLGDWVWRTIASAEEHGLGFQEETITEHILLDLATKHPASVRIKAFSRSQEAKNGADWEWHIGKPGRWLRMRVQAKRIKLPGETFQNLQKKKAGSTGGYQIDALIERARQERYNSAYCFYVHSRKWPTLRQWPVYNLLGAGPLSPQGCLFADASAVKKTQSNSLAKIAPVSIPWNLLVCHCASGVFNESGLADAAYAMLKASSELGLRIHGELDLEDPPPLFGPVEQLPGFLRDTPVFDDRASSIDLSRIAQERDVQGFVVIDEGEKE